MRRQNKRGKRQNTCRWARPTSPRHWRRAHGVQHRGPCARSLALWLDNVLLRDPARQKEKACVFGSRTLCKWHSPSSASRSSGSAGRTARGGPGSLCSRGLGSALSLAWWWSLSLAVRGVCAVGEGSDAAHKIWQRSAGCGRGNEHCTGSRTFVGSVALRCELPRGGKPHCRKCINLQLGSAHSPAPLPCAAMPYALVDVDACAAVVVLAHGNTTWLIIADSPHDRPFAPQDEVHSLQGCMYAQGYCLWR